MQPKDMIKLAFIIVLVVALGCLAVNQAMGFYYKADILANPCSACLKYNEQYTSCFEEQSKIKLDPLTGKEINKIKINISNIILP